MRHGNLYAITAAVRTLRNLTHQSFSYMEQHPANNIHIFIQIGINSIAWLAVLNKRHMAAFSG